MKKELVQFCFSGTTFSSQNSIRKQMTTEILENSKASWFLPLVRILLEFCQNSFEILSEFMLVQTALANDQKINQDLWNRSIPSYRIVKLS